MRCSWVVLVLLLAGCGVTSQHPLSDAETSTLDARLIGAWEALLPDLPADRDPPRVFVGRMPGQPNALEAVWLALDGRGDERVVEVSRFPLYCTRIDDRQVLSVGSAEEEAWLILRYDASEPDTLVAIGLDVAAVVAAVEEGALAGKVARWESDEPDQVHVTSSAATLSAWIRAQGDACWALDDPIRLRRLHLRS